MSDETFQLYSGQLAEFEIADVKEVARALARRRRAEGETAFPSLGELIEPLVLKRKLRIEERRAQREQRERIEYFWNGVLSFQMQQFGLSEEQVLEKFPEFKGTKP